MRTRHSAFVCGLLSLVTSLAAHGQGAVVAVGEPAAPVAPTDAQQCSDLYGAFLRVQHRLTRSAYACERQLPLEVAASGGVVGTGSCTASIATPCRGYIRQCEAVQARRDAAVAECRAKVSAHHARKKLEAQARNAGIDALDSAVPGVREAVDTVNRARHLGDRAREAYDFLGGRQTDREQYRTLSDAARSARGLAGGSPVARSFFDESLAEVNRQHEAALNRLDAAFAATDGWSEVPAATDPQWQFHARPDPALRARQAMLQAEIERNSSRSGGAHRALVRAREAEAERRRQLQLARQRQEEAARQARARQVEQQRLARLRERELEREREREERERRRAAEEVDRELERSARRGRMIGNALQQFGNALLRSRIGGTGGSGSSGGYPLDDECGRGPQGACR